MTPSDYIQAILAAITFVAVVVALFGQRFWHWVDRPQLEVDFDSDSERCFRSAVVPVCDIQGDGSFENVVKYYYRPRVVNRGGAVRNLHARVELYDEDGELAERFEPSALNWIGGKECVDLARGESEYFDLLSQVVSHEKRIQNRLTLELYNRNSRGIAWDRPQLSYDLEVTLYADNMPPITKTFKYKPKTDFTKPGRLL